MMSVIINGREYIPKPKKAKKKVTVPSIVCYRCHMQQSEVIDSRPMPTGVQYRRRKCLNCGARWDTIESGYAFADEEEVSKLVDTDQSDKS